MTRRDRETDAAPRILVADDSPHAIVQMTAWIRERWPSAEVWSATAPEEAVRIAAEERIEKFGESVIRSISSSLTRLGSRRLTASMKVTMTRRRRLSLSCSAPKTASPMA